MTCVVPLQMPGYAWRSIDAPGTLGTPGDYVIDCSSNTAQVLNTRIQVAAFYLHSWKGW